MKTNSEHLETISEIKQLMERSTRFISLSGISGIAAGLTAIAGAVILSIYFKISLFEQYVNIMNSRSINSSGIIMLIASALIIFITSLAFLLFFSSRKAKERNIPFWDNMAKRVFINLFLFLISGGLFCLILLYYGIYFLIVPSMLIFYGLALINVSKFTFNEIAQLGIIEIIVGFISSLLPVYPLLMWTIGFGFLHLVYGVFVYFKYEKAYE